VAQAVIGIDLGTQSTKAAVVRLDGKTLASASIPVVLESLQPGWAEQDPHLLEQSVVVAVAKVYEQVPEGTELIGLAVDGQMGGAIGVDRRLVPLTPFEAWLDIRSDGDRAEVIQRAGSEILAAGGIVPFVGPRVRRWLRERPSLRGQLANVLSVTSYITRWLTDSEEAVCDSTQANVYGCFDCRTGSWDPSLADAVGLPPELLPRVVPPTEIAGNLCRVVARRMGLKNGLPVAAGCGDGTAGWLAAGAVGPGTCVDTGGTSDHFAIAVDRFTPDLEGVMTCMPSIVPGLFHLMGLTFSTGIAKRWLRELVAAGDYNRLEEDATSISPGAHALLCVPHLSGRLTPFQPHVRGAFIGFNELTTAAHLYRVILESLAFEFLAWTDEARRLLPHLAIREVIAIGGSVRSALAAQIKADVLGVPYLRAPLDVNAARGAARVAAAGIGAVSLDDTTWLERVQRDAHRIEPEPTTHETYKRLRRLYCLLDGHLAPVYEALAEFKNHSSESIASCIDS
jgi:xylulokinase